MTDTASSPDPLAGKTVAIIGGTGQLGAALAARWAQAGLNIVLGSRDAATAAERARVMPGKVRGAENADAAAGGDVVVITVPFSAQEATLRTIAAQVVGKVVVDTTVPLMPPRVMRVQLPEAGSAAQRAQQVLGDSATLVSGFHNVAAAKLSTASAIDCDVLIFGDDPAARAVGVALADAAGLRGLHAGALANSAAAEAMTSILIFLNKTYNVDGAGIRITGDLHR